MGMRVDDVRDFYVKSGPAMFDKTSFIETILPQQIRCRN